MAKLIDILARELEGWPEDFSKKVGQAFDGSLHRCDEDGYAISGNYTNQKFTMCDDYGSEVVSRKEWKAAVDALKAEKEFVPYDFSGPVLDYGSKELTDEGLPPVGSHVVVHDDGSLIYGQGESGEVLAHVDGTAVIRMSYGLGCFLPRCLRTPEQIAIEIRSKAITQLMCDLDVPTVIATRAYDKGYRKLEPGEES